MLPIHLVFLVRVKLSAMPSVTKSINFISLSKSLLLLQKKRRDFNIMLFQTCQIVAQAFPLT